MTALFPLHELLPLSLFIAGLAYLIGAEKFRRVALRGGIQTERRLRAIPVAVDRRAHSS